MPTMQSFGHVARAVGVSICLILGTGAAWAHGASGGVHAGFGIQTPLAAPMAPMASPSARASAAARTTTPATHSASTLPPLSQPTAPTPLPSTVVQGCEGTVQVNCVAKAESTLGASGGDTTPVWSAPVPTTLPPAPTSDPITEPAQDTSLPPEQSGGASGVVITAGGGPTLTDCMSLWEPAVHMSKPDWKAVCIRTMNGIEEPSLAIHSVDPAAPVHAATKSASASHD